MKRLLILAVIALVAGCLSACVGAQAGASAPLNAPQSTLNTVTRAENVYNIEQPTRDPLFTGTVNITIAENGHLVFYDDTGVAIDLDNAAYLFIKMRNIMQNNIEKAGKANE